VLACTRAMIREQIGNDLLTEQDRSTWPAKREFWPISSDSRPDPLCLPLSLSSNCNGKSAAHIFLEVAALVEVVLSISCSSKTYKRLESRLVERCVHVLSCRSP
jgi:hypothetical protein